VAHPTGGELSSTPSELVPLPRPDACDSTDLNLTHGRCRNRTICLAGTSRSSIASIFAGNRFKRGLCALEARPVSDHISEYGCWLSRIDVWNARKMDRAIDVQGLTKSYRRQVVLTNLDLQVEYGSAVGLLGANGAGKTTLLKVLLGLLDADNGTLRTLGESSRELTADARGRIAYVPQTPNQFSWLTGRVMLRYLAAFYPSFDWEYANALSEQWKVSLRTPISVLSPGQQQRLSIVRALATRPELLVLDEPMASLDPATRIAVIDELIRERSRRRVTLLFSSHITGDLERLCTDFVVLACGRMAASGPINTFRQFVRTTVVGDEGLLDSLSFEGCGNVRKPRDGERILLVRPENVSRITDKLPASVRAETEMPDLETVFSEWMQ
jgi:ABC-type multidrug transport system ATPase subunit